MDKWISCNSQMPYAEYGEGRSVLTVDSIGVMRVAYFDGSNWCDPLGECLTSVRKFPITHWMPLPELSKAE